MKGPTSRVAAPTAGGGSRAARSLPLVLIVLAACADSPAPEDTIPEDARWTAHPALRIGALDDSVYAFDTPRALAVDASGAIYTSHRQAGRINRWSADGALLSTERWTTAPRTDPWIGSPGPKMPFRDGSLYAIQAEVLAQMAGRESSERRHLRLALTGEVLDTFAIVDVDDDDIGGVRHPTSNDWLLATQPFTRRPAFAASAALGVFGLVGIDEPSDASTPSLNVLVTSYAGDTLVSRHVPYAPITVSDQRVQHEIEALAQSWHRGRARDLRLDRLRAMAKDVLFLPGTHMPVHGLVIGRDGTLWLRGPGFLGSDQVTWRVLAPDGAPLAFIDLPARVAVRAADRSAVWGTELDDMGVPFVVRYSVSHSADPN